MFKLILSNHSVLIDWWVALAVVAFSSRARICGECWTIYSPPAPPPPFFFFFFWWRLACAHWFRSLGQDQSTVAQRAETTVDMRLLHATSNKQTPWTKAITSWRPHPCFSHQDLILFQNTTSWISVKRTELGVACLSFGCFPSTQECGLLLMIIKKTSRQHIVKSNVRVSL